MRRKRNTKRNTVNKESTSESWESFHRQYCSEQYKISAHNPATLRRMGHVPNSFGGASRSDRGLVGQFLMRQDSLSSMGGSSHSGSERGRGNRMDDSSSRRTVFGRVGKRRGNVKIGNINNSKSGRRWSFNLFSSFRK